MVRAQQLRRTCHQDLIRALPHSARRRRVCGQLPGKAGFAHINPNNPNRPDPVFTAQIYRLYHHIFRLGNS